MLSDDLTPTADARRLPSPERHMTVSPLDMRQAKFSVAMRGFDKADVSTFLQEAADGFELALRENERLRHEIVRLEASLNQFRELEGSLKTTLMSAQKVAETMSTRITPMSHGQGFTGNLITAIVVIIFELMTLSWIRWRFFDTGFFRSFVSIMFGGVIIAAISAALGGAAG